MTEVKVLLTRKWPQAAEQRAEEWFSAQLNEGDQKMSVAELQQAMRDFDVICPTVSDHLIDAAIIDTEGRRCRALCNFGVGFNNIDTEAAKAAGIIVTNTPGVLTDCTADIAMTLLLMIARRAGEGERLVRTKRWDGWCPTHMLATKVSGKKLGLIGFGRIAHAVAKRAQAGFDMEISYFDPYLAAGSDNTITATRCESVEEVLRTADFVSLHCPGGGENTGLINAERLAQMQSHAFLINTARGDVVVEDDLVTALKNGVIAGAGLDVFAREPTVTEALLTMENVVLFPHLGSASTETRAAMGFCALENVQAVLSGKEPPNRVA